MSWHESLNAIAYHKLQARLRKPWLARNNRELTLNKANVPMLNFTSNNYLGLALHPDVIQAGTAYCNKYGIGSGGAQTLSGYSTIQQQLEQSIATWLGYDSTLIFPSGYQLNTALLAALAKITSPYKIHIWLDKRCHASIIDGTYLSKCNFSTFTTQNFELTIAKIYDMPFAHHIVITEGIFSMDGSCTYLSQLRKLKQSTQDNILIILDDSHGIGVTGQTGKGSLENLEIVSTNNFVAKTPIDILIGTFSKAFGTHGGFLCTNSLIAKYLGQNCRSLLFSSALPPAILSATAKSLEIIQSNIGKQLRNQLKINISQFKQQFNKLKPQICDESPNQQLNILNQNNNISPIQLIEYSSMKQLQATYDYLISNNILVGKIFYPTIAKNKYRLRISLNTHHTSEDIKYLIDMIYKCD